jgi:serine phosphatase RsbU (regulator of sigma subunit)
VNRLFYKNTESNHYATAFFALYEEERRRLRWVNCGHNPPLVIRASGEVERLEPTATVLGLFEEWDCSLAEVELSPGDILAIYTDGVSEATGEDGDEFGEERLMEAVRSRRGLTAEEILNA